MLNNRFGEELFRVLNLLDEGLRIYRHGFVSFMLLTSIWVVPCAVGIGLSIIFSMEWIGVLAVLLALPLALLLVHALGRAVLIVQHNQPLHLGTTLLNSLAPVRLIGMGCYSFIFLFLVQIVTTVIYFVCLCPGISGFSFLLGGLAGVPSDSALGTGVAIIVGTLVGVLFILFYAFSLVMSGATYTSLVYALQPFVQDNLGFGKAMERSMALVGYRLASNVLAFFSHQYGLWCHNHFCDSHHRDDVTLPTAAGPR
ncbi:MAG: hypothetical protein HC893_09160 [Chloroflexaceae bacterium]|nr:hypothetical protein [Chloroflexaceae bacterium]